MTRCENCGLRVHSIYIRCGEKGLLRKVSHYCNNCDTYYDLNNKLYTVKENLYTVYNPILKSEYDQKSKFYIVSSKVNDDYKIYQKSIQISMGRVG